mmetsp:Transcript_17329/g.54122  ORF Transcript_17329/g.54122 Transcript_17329/m.54122 type:complete len:90 (-) Transcript_17329:288-557(-)
MSLMETLPSARSIDMMYRSRFASRAFALGLVLGARVRAVRAKAVLGARVGAAAFERRAGDRNGATSDGPRDERARIAASWWRVARPRAR